MNTVASRFCIAESQKTDSLIELLQSELHDTVRINTLKSLAIKLKLQNPDTSILLSSLALELSQKNNWEKGIGTCYHVLGELYWRKSNYSLSLSYYDKAVDIWGQFIEEKPNSIFALKAMASTTGNIGVVYSNLGNYPQALKYYFRTLEVMEKIDNKKAIATMLGNIGIIYYYEGDYPEAMKYYLKALEMAEELGNESAVSRHLGNIGIIYFVQGDFQKSLDYYMRAMELDNELENRRGVARHLGNIGIVYFELGKYPEAMEYYLNALKIKRQLGVKNLYASTLGNIGTLLTVIESYDEAEAYLDSALQVSQLAGINDIAWIYEAFAELYEKQHRFKDALENLKLAEQWNDTLFNEQKSKEIGKLEAKHEFETAESERKRLAEEERVMLREAQHRRDNLQYSGILIFLALLGIGLFAVVARPLRAVRPIYLRLSEGMIFFTFLLFFEFTLVLLDPYIEAYSAGAPAIKLGFNAVLAALIFPLHSFFETKLKKRLAN